MAVGLTFFFEYFFYALAITLLMSTGIANTFLGMGCLLGMGGVSRTLDKIWFIQRWAAYQPNGRRIFRRAVKGLLK